jgi:hypothetical protein
VELADTVEKLQLAYQGCEDEAAAAYRAQAAHGQAGQAARLQALLCGH